jgi:SAM-dependent methyltransferase
MKSAMTTRLPLRSKFESGLAIFRAHRSGDFSNAAGSVRNYRELCGYLEQYVGVPLEKARVLDMGCGQTATMSLLFRAEGAHVTGIDIEVPTLRMGPGTFAEVWRRNGAERALKSLARHLLFDGKFVHDLAQELGRPISIDGLDLRIMDATRMEFEDSTFDLVHSMAVFEHIDDVPGAVRELNRVLKPGGIAVITPHLFASLSGGHNLEWLWPEERGSEKVEPWDHLRKNRHPANAFMNRLTLSEYQDAFRANMDIVHEQLNVEGVHYLTKELEAELTAIGYSREDLLTRTVTFFARKRQ